MFPKNKTTGSTIETWVKYLITTDALTANNRENKEQLYTWVLLIQKVFEVE